MWANAINLEELVGKCLRYHFGLCFAYFNLLPSSRLLLWPNLKTAVHFLTQRRVTAAQAGLAFCSEPSRAERVPRDAKCAENETLRVLCVSAPLR